MFVVVAHHNTGHGELGTPFFITCDLNQAVTQAKKAQELGFEFYSNDACVSIYNMKIGSFYNKADCYFRTPVWIRRFDNRLNKWHQENWLKDPQKLDPKFLEELLEITKENPTPAAS